MLINNTYYGTRGVYSNTFTIILQNKFLKYTFIHLSRGNLVTFSHFCSNLSSLLSLGSGGR